MELKANIGKIEEKKSKSLSKEKVEEIEELRGELGLFGRILNKRGRVAYKPFVRSLFLNWQGMDNSEEIKENEDLILSGMPFWNISRELYQKIYSLIEIPKTNIKRKLIHPKDSNMNPLVQTTPILRRIEAEDIKGRTRGEKDRRYKARRINRIEKLFEKLEINQDGFYSSRYYRIARKIFLSTQYDLLITSDLLKDYQKSGHRLNRLPEKNLTGYFRNRIKDLWDSPKAQKKVEIESIRAKEYLGQMTRREENRKPLEEQIGNVNVSAFDIRIESSHRVADNNPNAINFSNGGLFEGNYRIQPKLQGVALGDFLTGLEMNNKGVM